MAHEMFSASEIEQFEEQCEEWERSGATSALVAGEKAVKMITRPPYSALIRAIGEQASELYPNAPWDVVSRELEQLWRSYVSATGMGWEAVAPRIRMAWEDAARLEDRH
ncbi:MAG TPA: hypothetical protein VIT62_05170 [Lysobacter sp.]